MGLCASKPEVDPASKYAAPTDIAQKAPQVTPQPQHSTTWHAPDKNDTACLPTLLADLAAAQQGSWNARLLPSLTLLKEQLNAASASLYAVCQQATGPSTVLLAVAGDVDESDVGLLAQAPGPNQQYVAADAARSAHYFSCAQKQAAGLYTGVLGNGPGGLQPNDLPGDWRSLNRKFAHKAFLCTPIRQGGKLLGALVLSAADAELPAAWSPATLGAVCGLLVALVQEPQLLAALDMVMAIGSVRTLDELIVQVTKGASTYCAALALVTPSCRVALLREDAMAAVIFHDRPLPGRLSSAGAHSSSASGGINTPVHAGTQDAQQPGNEFGPSHAATAVVDGVEPGTPGRYGSPLPRRMASASASASVPSRSTANKSIMRGTSLALGHTLLELVVQRASNIAIPDVPYYIQAAHTMPEDIKVLSRGDIPHSMVLVMTYNALGKPFMALYATYTAATQMSILQSLVKELAGLLALLTPTILCKLHEPQAPPQLAASVSQALSSVSGPGHTSNSAANGDASIGTNHAALMAASERTSIMAEWQYLHDVVLDPAMMNAAQPGVKVSSIRRLSQSIEAGAMAGSPHNSLLGVVQHSIRRRSLEEAASPSQPLTAVQQHQQQRRNSLEAYLNSARGNMPTIDSNEAAHHSVPGHDDTAREKELAAALGLSHGPSFSIRKAKEDTSSALTPIMTGVHDRLKAITANRIAHGSASKHAGELAAIKATDKIGQGGYGSVFRGTYHGSEVAIKVIQPPALLRAHQAAAPGAGRLRRYATQSFLDAFELAIGLNITHPHITQMLTFFTDVRVCEPDTMDGNASSRSFGFSRGGSPQGSSSLKTGSGQVGANSSAPRMLLALAPWQTGPGADSDEDSDSDDEAARGMLADELRHILTGHGSMTSANSGTQGGMDSPMSPGTGRGGSECTGPLQAVMGFDVTVPAIAIVMEYCDAGSLLDAMDNGWLMQPPRAGAVDVLLIPNMLAILTTLLEVALALRHLHSMNLVHCDIKPANVLLKAAPRDPRGWITKLSDFGLAKLMEAGQDGKLSLPRWHKHGTMTHSAPELLAGQHGLDASLDVYAFGVTMWQLYTGLRAPYGKLAPAQISKSVRAGLRPRWPVTPPAEYASLAVACWEADRSKRPTSGDLVKQLEGLVEFLQAAVANGAKGARAGFNGSGSRGTSPARSSHSSFSSAAPMLAGGGTPRGAAPAIPQQQGSPAHAAQLDI